MGVLGVCWEYLDILYKKVLVYQQFLLGESKNSCFEPFLDIWDILGVLRVHWGYNHSTLGLMGVVSGVLGVLRHP